MHFHLAIVQCDEFCFHGRSGIDSRDKCAYNAKCTVKSRYKGQRKEAKRNTLYKTGE